MCVLFLVTLSFVRGRPVRNLKGQEKSSAASRHSTLLTLKRMAAQIPSGFRAYEMIPLDSFFFSFFSCTRDIQKFPGPGIASELQLRQRQVLKPLHHGRNPLHLHQILKHGIQSAEWPRCKRARHARAWIPRGNSRKSEKSRPGLRKLPCSSFVGTNPCDKGMLVTSLHSVPRSGFNLSAVCPLKAFFRFGLRDSVLPHL